MNKIRIIGLLALAAGIILINTVEHDAIGFFSGLLIGAGSMLLITGKIGKASL